MNLLPNKKTLSKIGSIFNRAPAAIGKVKDAIKTGEDIIAALKNKGTSQMPSITDTANNINDAAKSISSSQQLLVIGAVGVGAIILILLMRGK